MNKKLGIVILLIVLCLVGIIATMSLMVDMSIKNNLEIDPYNCEIVSYDPKTDISTYTGKYNQECLKFQELPLSEQYAWCDKNPTKCN